MGRGRGLNSLSGADDCVVRNGFPLLLREGEISQRHLKSKKERNKWTHRHGISSVILIISSEFHD
jgi:hypothetical protein